MGETFKRQASEYTSMEEFVNVFHEPTIEVSDNTSNKSDIILSSQSSESSGYFSTEEENVGVGSADSDSQMIENAHGDIDEEHCGTIDGDNILQNIEALLELQENEHISHINGIAIDQISDIRQVFEDEKGGLIVRVKRTITGDLEEDNENVEFLEVLFVYNRRDSLSSILLHKIRRQTKIFSSIEFQKSNPCHIRSYLITGNFLSCKDGKLTLSPIENEDDETALFREYRFTALQTVNDRTSRVQLRMFESQSEKKYVTAKSLNDIKLQSFTSKYSTDKPDGRFFKLIKSTSGYYFLESAVNYGCYLCWINGKIKLKIMDNTNDMSDADSANSSEAEEIVLGH